MKKQLLTILAAGAVSSMFAQLPVSTTPQNKKAVLEEFTGVYCGYCPDGHFRATNIYNANPTNIVLINVHSGGYANVAVGEPDLKTTAGNAIDPMAGMNILGYPAGDVSRMNFGTLNPAYAQQTVTPFGMAQSRGTWTYTIPNVLAQSAYCNVALQGTINATTRVLTVQAAVYYTANSPVGTNSLNIVLLQDNIVGPQHNYGSPTLYNAANYNPDGSYNHNHVLRTTLTGNFGIPVSPTTAGSTYTTTLTYTIPATYGAAGKTTQALLGNMKLAAFVTQTNTFVVNAAHGPIVLNNIPFSLDGAVTNITTTDGSFLSDPAVCTGPLKTNFKFMNNGSTTITQAVFSYNVNGGAPQTYTWTGSLPPLTMSQTMTFSPISFAPIASNSLNISIVSVNGSADMNPLNNTVTKIIPYAVTANTLAMQMDFTQDRWGTEVGWGVYDEVTSTPVAGAVVTAGTYPDLAASGTLLHTHNFTVSANTCYKLVVTDAYGDGVNGGYGAGNYSLKSGVTQIIYSNGQYATGETKLFKSANVTSIAAIALNISGLNVYPNPASNSATINFVLSQNENINVVVVNALGQTVYNEALTLDAGSHDIKLNTENWASGIYNMNFTTSSGSASRKLTISK
jgi:hypothetical protein